MNLKGKNAIVTGGARGLGKAVALILAKEGVNIGITGRNEENLKNTVEELKKLGVQASFAAFSMDEETAVQKGIADLTKDLGGVDILINNAAVDLSNLFHLKTADEFRKTLDVNVVGAFNCSKRVYRHMLDQEYGRIINISSTNGINTYYPMCIDYDASKAALISLTHNLAFEYGPYINVNAIAPGFIGTDNELDGYDEEFLKEEQEKIMVNRYGKPEEVAYLVKFLISDEANFINNTIIRIDGGQKGSC